MNMYSNSTGDLSCLTLDEAATPIDTYPWLFQVILLLSIVYE